MKFMKYSLICTDIDGTLLDQNKVLLPQVKEALKKEADKGVKIELVSGRMPAGVELIEQELGISCVKVCHAGSYILLGDQRISNKYLPAETLEKVYNTIAKAHGLQLWIFCEETWYVTGIDKFIEKEIVDIKQQPIVVDIKDLVEQWKKEGKGPNKILLAADPEEIRIMYQEIENYNWPEIDYACSADTFIELLPKGINKGEAVCEICDRLGIKREEVVAFGDHELDIPLLEAAGIGIAMENAIPELKEKADYVTKTNNEGGIAYALENYLAK